MLKAILRRLVAIPKRFGFVFTKAGVKNRRKLASYQNKYIGKTAVLLANGPSLANEDLSFTKNYVTFGLNRVYLGLVDLKIDLDFLVCVNRLVLSQFSGEFEELQCERFFSWDERKRFKRDNAINWVHKGFSTKEFSDDISRGINPAATVTYAALQLIYYMGFKKVIILGMDHNFTLEKSKIPNTKETYTHSKDVNHFIENYFPKGVKWETPDLLSSEYFYKVARDRFEADDRQIYDCTTGGKCEVFVKTTVNQALNG